MAEPTNTTLLGIKYIDSYYFIRKNKDNEEIQWIEKGEGERRHNSSRNDNQSLHYQGNVYM